MALKTLSDLVLYLVSRGQDGAATLAFLLFGVQQIGRAHVHTARFYVGEFVNACRVAYAWSPGFYAPWGI